MQTRKMPGTNGTSERSPLLQDQENGAQEDRQVCTQNQHLFNCLYFSSCLSSQKQTVQTLELGQNGQSWKILPSLPPCQVRHVLMVFLPCTHCSTVLNPLASSMFAPGIDQIAESLKTSRNAVIGCQTGFVVMLGIGPLILAPLSETFGRKPLYLICFTVFTLLQIPTALSPNLPCLITMRTLAGFFGSTSALPMIHYIR